VITPPAAIEALLFASGEPLEKKRLAAHLGITAEDLRVALAALAEQLHGRGLTLVVTESAAELRTAPEAAELVKQLRESELSRDLGKASLETLAVVAYEDGATRGEIDWVRGVNSSASVRTLLLRGLIEGHEDPRDKRRIRYALTTDALAHLGLGSVHELPRYPELSRGAAEAVEESAAAHEPAP
jgi:segregation and condensation protein B